MEITKFVEYSYIAFSSFDKPALATDITHCEECQDHNDEINGADRKELTVKQIGTLCWGISSFLTPQAMGYYIPRFIELAVTAQNDICDDPYMCAFINQIGLNFSSEQFSLFTAEQRSVVYKCLSIIKEQYFSILEEHCWEDDIDPAIEQWRT